MKLDNNNHSVFCLYYHLVLVVKYRRKVFTDDMSQYAKDIFVRLSEPYNISLEEWNHDIDHIHISSRHILTVNYQNSSMPTKAQAQDL